MRYRLEYALYRLFAFLMRILPLEAASWLSGALWRGLAPFSKRHARAVAQLRMVFPEKTDAEREAIARQMWDTMGRVFGESFRLVDFLKSDRVTVENAEAVKTRLLACDGFIACSAHQGNWELAAVPLTHMGISTAGIYQRLKNPFVDDMARSQRGPLYPAGLLPKGRATALLAMKHVKAGGALAVMADLRERRGVKVPFFGRMAASNPFPAMIAVSLDKPVFVAHVMREPGARFRIRLQEIEISRTGDRDADILETTARIQAALENNIRARPGEWMWAHERWT